MYVTKYGPLEIEVEDYDINVISSFFDHTIVDKSHVVNNVAIELLYKDKPTIVSNKGLIYDGVWIVAIEYLSTYSVTDKKEMYRSVLYYNDQAIKNHGLRNIKIQINNIDIPKLITDNPYDYIKPRFAKVKVEDREKKEQLESYLTEKANELYSNSE